MSPTRAAAKAAVEAEARTEAQAAVEAEAQVSAGRALWRSILTWVQWGAWALFLLTLPFTSFPFFPPAIGGGALVRPLSIYPLIVLVVLVVLPRLLTRPVPKTILTLLPFVLVAAASSLLSALQGIEGAMGVSVTARLARAFITLGLGIAMYLAVALFPRRLEDLRSALRWLYGGFVLALAWGSLQAVYVIHFSKPYFQLLNRFQRYVSIRKLFETRVSGLTYEPNWFAEQISFLLMPWLLASVLSNTTVFPWRWRRVTVELFLLSWAAAVLPFTFSRAGLGVLVALAVVSVLFFRPARGGNAAQKPSRRAVLTRRLIEAGLAVAVLLGGFYIAGTNNAFFSRLWNYWSEVKNTSLTGYFEYIGFGARFTYAETALRTYAAHPVFGVGLGNYAFYFDEMLPDSPLAAMPEVLRVITPGEGRNRLITAKVLYLRLLAETGLVGTAAFLAFLVALFGCALYLWLSPHPEGRFWGMAGLLGLTAFVLSAFSFDSFALPNMWIVFGLITAAAWVVSRTPEADL